jgi:hypothetical protein
MRSRERELLARQALLQQRSGLLRDALVWQAQTLAPALQWADRGWSAWHWLRHHPQWPLGAALLLVAVRPRRVVSWGMRWSGRALWMWQLWRRVGPLLRPVVRRP